MSLGQSNASGKHSTSRSPTPLSRVAASPSSALLPTNRTRPGRKSHLHLASWRVSRGMRSLTFSFSRTVTGLQALSKQGGPQSSTAIPREKRLRSNAEQVFIVNSPAVKGGSHETDKLAVVDPELRVHGILGLRVADASVMPHIITGPGTNAAALMVGGRAAKIILG